MEPYNGGWQYLPPMELEPGLSVKWHSLLDILSGMHSAAVAYSGGVDSALLAAAAYLALGERMAAFTVHSVVEPPGDTRAAGELAGQVGFRHYIVDFDDLAQLDFRANSPERCYFCKLERLKTLVQLAEQAGLKSLLEGSNVDDDGQRRPGKRAVKELGVRSTLIEAGLRKIEIRALARALGLAVWERPSSPCLATRFPYGKPITQAGLQRVAVAEAVLHARGYRLIRVRDYGSMARVEVDPEMLERLSADRHEVTVKLRQLGYRDIILDPKGYRSGSLDEGLLDSPNEGLNE
jgi:pyridinium-3,5-biscarboxylic acid mononucleotide sulfurtransferase